MVLAGVQLGSVAVIPRNDSAQPLFPFNLALVRRFEIRTENLVPDIHSLMRALVIIVRKPLAVDVIKLIQAYAKEVVQAFSFNFSDIAAVFINHTGHSP